MMMMMMMFLSHVANQNKAFNALMANDKGGLDRRSVFFTI